VNVGRAPPWPSRRARPDKGESPNLGTFSPLISLAYVPHFLGVPTRSRPREHRRCAAARPAPSVASRHLTVVHRHPAKGRFFPCLDTFWSRSYRVKRQGGRRRETSSPARCGRAAFPLGQSVEHPWGAPKPRECFRLARWATCGCGHRRSGWILCSWPPRAEPHARLHRA
jgi:hypothetical protein